MADAHDLHVFAPGRVFNIAGSPIDPLFNRQNDAFQRAHRGVGNSNRGVVGEWSCGARAAPEEFLQVRRAGLNQHVDECVVLGIESVEIGLKPAA